MQGRLQMFCAIKIWRHCFCWPFLFTLQSVELPLLPLANTLAKASRGSWNAERTKFTVARGFHGAAMPAEWYLETEYMQIFGVVQVFFTDAHSQQFQFP